MFKDDGTVEDIDKEEAKSYFNQFESRCEAHLNAFPLMYIAARGKYGKKCFKPPVTSWTAVDNRRRTQNFEVEQILGECYQKSAYNYKFVVSLDISKGACVLQARTDEFAKKLMTDKLEKCYIIFIG